MLPAFIHRPRPLRHKFHHILSRFQESTVACHDPLASGNVRVERGKGAKGGFAPDCQEVVSSVHFFLVISGELNGGARYLAPKLLLGRQSISRSCSLSGLGNGGCCGRGV